MLKKKTLFGVFTGLVLFGTSAVGETIDGINYELDKMRHTATITGHTSVPDHLAIDKVTYEGETYAVTTVGEKAFSNCNTLKSVSLPSVLEVGWDAFYACTGLAAVSLPSATNLNPRAYARCTALRKFSAPKAEIVGSDAFSESMGLSEVAFPSATQISGNAFTRVVPDTLMVSPELKAKGGFPSARNIVAVNLASAVIDGVTYTYGLTESGYKTAAGTVELWGITPGASTTAVTIPATLGGRPVTGIPGSAVCPTDFAKVTAVTVPASVQTIDVCAFAGCTTLQTVTFEGQTAPQVGSLAFDGVAAGAIARVHRSSVGFADQDELWNGLTIAYIEGPVVNLGVKVNGKDVACLSSEGWAFSGDLLVLSGTGPFVLSGTNTASEVHVQQTSSSTVILSNLVLTTSKSIPCITVGVVEGTEGGAGSVESKLHFVGDNRLTNASGEQYEFRTRQTAIFVYRGSTVRLNAVAGVANKDAVLTAQGGWGSAAIGGSRDYSTGRIVIDGGTINATGGKLGAGIGSGFYYGSEGELAGTVMINGGRITAQGGGESQSGYPGVGIGAYQDIHNNAGLGCDIRISGGTVVAKNGGRGSGIAASGERLAKKTTISGGSVQATIQLPEKDSAPLRRVTVTGGWADDTPVELDGLAGYGKGDIVSVGGKVYLWLPDGSYRFTASGRRYSVTVAGADIEANPYWPTGVTLDGTEVATIADYDPETGVLSITNEGSHALSGANTKNEIRVEILTNATVTLDNLTLTCALQPIAVGEDCEVTLLLKGENALTATSEEDAARRAALWAEKDSRLTIDRHPDCATDAEGSLTATGAYYGAGIGCGYNQMMGDITIAGGTIVAYGGKYAAGLGGGRGGGHGGIEVDQKAPRARIVIAGGCVTATGGHLATGIGGGDVGWGPQIEITGGRVKASHGGEVNVADIGAPERLASNKDSAYTTVAISGGTVEANALGKGASSYSGEAKVTITGGSVLSASVSPAASNATERVWRVTVPEIAASGAVTIAGLPVGYGTTDIVAIDGKAYLWLPNGNYEFAADGFAYRAEVADRHVTATKIGPVMPPLAYIDADGTEKTCIVYQVVTSDTAIFTTGRWYAVTGTVSRGMIEVRGSAHLILCDGASLTATATRNAEAGVRVMKGNGLSIYGQSEGTGRLTAEGHYGGSGIGANDGDAGGSGTVIISGGTVTATGSTSGAGIGGGNGNSNGTVIINGGTVTATGGNGAAGIGGGHFYGCGGTVTINGGTVTATAGYGAAGIGGGKSDEYPGTFEHQGEGSTFTINGGTVTATGSGSLSRPAIGEGYGGTAPGTVTFAESRGWLVKAGKTEAQAQEVAASTFARLHDDSYAHIEVRLQPVPVQIDSVAIRTVDGHLQFEATFASTKGASYTLLRSEDLAVTIDQWKVIVTGLAPEGERFMLADPNPPAEKAFYTVVTGPR